MAERGQQGFKHPDAARGLRREKLLEQAAQGKGLAHFRGGGDARHKQEIHPRGGFHHLRIKAGSHAEGGSRPAGGLHLFRRQEGSRAHQHSGDFPGNAGNGFRGGGRSERDFHAGAAVVQQRFGKGYGLVRVMEDDDGDKPDGG